MKISMVLIQREMARLNLNEQDNPRTDYALAVAGACYALEAASSNSYGHWREVYKETAKKLFPFDENLFLSISDNPEKQLIMAGALIALEIERLQNEEK